MHKIELAWYKNEKTRINGPKTTPKVSFSQSRAKLSLYLERLSLTLDEKRLNEINSSSAFQIKELFN